MRRLVRSAALLWLGVMLAGCQSLANAKLFLPAGWVGLEAVAADVRVEAGASPQQRELALGLREEGRARLGRAFSEVHSAPIHVFCFSPACFERFGGGSPRAKSFGSHRTLIGPHALSAAYVAHEWWHAELQNRLGFWRWRKLPRWFDEGAAVWVSDDPRYGDAMYRRVLAEGIVPPALGELRTFDDFTAAIGRHGDHLWARKPAEAVTVVYPTAAHEFRRWFGIVGLPGLRRLIAALADGADFDTLYPALEHQARRAP